MTNQKEITNIPYNQTLSLNIWCRVNCTRLTVRLLGPVNESLSGTCPHFFVSASNNKSKVVKPVLAIWVNYGSLSCLPVTHSQFDTLLSASFLHRLLTTSCLQFPRDRITGLTTRKLRKNASNGSESWTHINLISLKETHMRFRRRMLKEFGQLQCLLKKKGSIKVKDSFSCD